MSRLYNQIMMEQYGDLELAAIEEERREEDERNAEYELYEAKQDLIIGITDNPPMEFYWKEKLHV